MYSYGCALSAQQGRLALRSPDQVSEGPMLAVLPGFPPVAGASEADPCRRAGVLDGVVASERHAAGEHVRNAHL